MKLYYTTLKRLIVTSVHKHETYYYFNIIYYYLCPCIKIINIYRTSRHLQTDTVRNKIKQLQLHEMSTDITATYIQ